MSRIRFFALLGVVVPSLVYAYPCGVIDNSVKTAQGNQRQQITRDATQGFTPQPAPKDMTCADQVTSIYQTDISGGVAAVSDLFGAPLSPQQIHSIANGVQNRANNLVCQGINNARQAADNALQRAVTVPSLNLPSVPPYIQQ